MIYQGEHLWVGQWGHISIVAAFVSALTAAMAYYFAARNRNDSTDSARWTAIGDYAYIIHGVGIIALIGLLFYAMYHQMYEYAYVFDHVSPDLPMRYILSAFWEGQEGVFSFGCSGTSF
ncbi:MAG: hypothetical protein IPM26_08330 [Saprospiraceae bacterium]|nr:hypothetical protein [Saprospiraceae bacterium]